MVVQFRHLQRKSSNGQKILDLTVLLRARIPKKSKFFYCRIDAKNPCIEDTFDSLQTPGDDMTKIKALSKIFDRMGFLFGFCWFGWFPLMILIFSFNRIFTNLVAVLDQTFPSFVMKMFSVNIIIFLMCRLNSFRSC